jgi:hypothetical protein
MNPNDNTPPTEETPSNVPPTPPSDQPTPESTADSPSFAAPSSVITPTAPTTDGPTGPAFDTTALRSSADTPPTPQVVTGGDNVAPPAASPTPTVSGGRGKKKLLTIIGLVVVLLLLAVGYVFAFYLPNKPENVWKTGLDRTGDGLNGLITDATEQNKLSKLTTSELSGNLTFESKAYGKATGSYSAKFDDNSADGNLSVSLPQQGDKNIDLSLKTLLETPKDSTYPDVYLKFSGINALGLDAFIPGINQYDGTWINISSKYIESHAAVARDLDTKSDVKTADVAGLVRAVSGTTRDYLLTSQPDKAVLENKGFQGKETVDGIKTYRYKAAVNKDHAKAYCDALGNAVAGTDLFKKLVDESDRADSKKSFVEDCKNGVNDIKSGETFDVWIDSGYKLIHKVRLYDTEDKDSYLDFGQTYKGDHNLYLFANLHDASAKADMTSTTTFNFDDMSAQGALDVKSKEGEGYTMSLTFKLAANDKKVTIDKPANSVPVETVLHALGLDQLFETPTVPASDTHNF